MKKITTQNLILDLDQIIYAKIDHEAKEAAILLRDFGIITISGPAFADFVEHYAQPLAAK